MRQITISEAEFKRAFDEILLKLEKSLKEPRQFIGEDDSRFRTVNYYVRELQDRLEKG